MIKYACPKCRAPMMSPASMAGHWEMCPACGAPARVPNAPRVERIALVPDRGAARVPNTRRVERIALVLDRGAAGAAAAWHWIRHRRAAMLLAVVALNVLLLTGLARWLLPDWLPRPVVSIETPGAGSRGMFPPRAEVARILAAHGYHPLEVDPAPDVLRGRRLLAYSYVRNANYPAETAVKVWCPLNRRDCVRALSAEASLGAASRLVESAKSGGLLGPEAMRRAEAIADHLVGAAEAMHAFCGASPKDTMPVSTETEPNPLGAGTIERNYAAARCRGFELEAVKVVLNSAGKTTIEVVVLIVKDARWDVE